MAASIVGVLETGLADNVNSTKILVVGAGGIGCELIKNLVLTGFCDIELVSMSTCVPAAVWVCVRMREDRTQRKLLEN